MGPGVVVRRATRTDWAQLQAIELGSFSGDRLSPRSLRRWIDAPTGDLYVALLAGQVVGYGLIIFRRGSRSGRLYSIALAPAGRGQGMGAGLLQVLQQCAKRRGCKDVRLEVAQSNAAAQALYYRCGYRLIGHRLGYYENGDDACLMCCSLGAPAPPNA